MSKAAQTRAFIIERTAPLFNRQGYAGTSMSDITTATGLTKGSIYGNFCNKDEVALAAFDYNLKKIGDIAAAAMDDSRCAKDQLLAYINIYKNRSGSPFLEAGCPIQNAATETGDNSSGLRQKAGEAILCLKKRLASIIKKGIHNKEFRADIDPDRSALTIIAAVQGAIIISKATGNIEDRKTILHSVEELIRDLELIRGIG